LVSPHELRGVTLTGHILRSGGRAHCAACQDFLQETEAEAGLEASGLHKLLKLIIKKFSGMALAVSPVPTNKYHWGLR
jgi:hypothetical protein